MNKKENQPILPPVGRYSNFFRIHINPGEFVLDFGHKIVDADTVQLHTRIVTSPQHAKLMHDLLGQMIKKYVENIKGKQQNGQEGLERR